MSVNFSPDPATRAWLATLPGMGDAFPEIGTGSSRPPTQVADAGGRPVDGDAAQAQELSFWDVLDVVNPLQHIPIVNHIYRAVTGDTIKPHAQIIGSTLFGGPLGFAVATASTVVEAANGEPMMATVARAFGSEQPVAVAAAADGPVVPAPPARQAMTLADPVPVPVAPTPGGPGSPSLVQTGGAPTGSVPTSALASGPQPGAAPVPSPQAMAPAAPVSAAAVSRGPTEFFTRLQNPGGSKSVRPLATPTAPPTAPQSLGHTNNAASAPGSFRPVRIPAYVEPAAEVAAPTAEAAPASAPAVQASAAQAPAAPAAPVQAPAPPAVSTPAVSTPAVSAHAVAASQPPARPTAALVERPTPVAPAAAPANSDAGRKPSRDEISSQMLRALDRYQAAQRTGDRRVTPVAGGVF
jgi:hypothetical protein